MHHTIQVKAMSKKNAVPNLKDLIAEYLVVCRKVFDEKPAISN